MSKPFLSVYESGYWDVMFNERNKPMQPSKPKRSKGFFHYTTLSAAEKILNLNAECKDKIKGHDAFKHKDQNDYITLLASHFLFLNDGEELFQGIEVIKDVFEHAAILRKKNKDVKSRLKEFEQIIKSLKPNCLENAPNFFILCFCSDGNLLTQWEWYGKECGIAIEFDLNNCCLEGNIVSPDNMSIAACPVYPHKVVYTDTDKEAMKKKLLSYKISDESDVDYFSLLALITAAHMKHIGFQNEKETRVLLAPLYKYGVNPNKALSLIKYRESNGVIKPYIEVNLKHKINGRHPIKSVTVGPGHNQSLVYNAIQKLIHTRFAPDVEDIEEPISSDDRLYEYTKIGDIEVRRSTIPFRG